MAADFLNALQNTITGDDTSEQINGTSDNDNISGLGGDDEIHGLAGNDLINGGDGNDTIWGGDGHDWIAGLAGQDNLNGEGGHDWIQIGSTSWYQNGPQGSVVDGGNGSDVIDRESFASNSTINGGSNEADFDRGGFNGDILRYRDIVNYLDAVTFDNGIYQITTTGGFTDTVSNIEYLAFGPNNSTYGYEALFNLNEEALYFGGLSNDTIQTSQAQVARVLAGAGDDQIEVGNNGNWVSAGKGNDAIISGGGVDYIYTGDGADTVNSGDGDDAIIASDSGNQITSGNGNDFMAASESTIFATSGNEVIIGSNNTIVFNYSIKEVLNFSNATYDLTALSVFSSYSEQVLSDTFPFFINPGPVDELLINSLTVQTPVGTVFFNDGDILEFTDFRFKYGGFVLQDNTSNGVRLHLTDTSVGNEEDDIYFNVNINELVDGNSGTDKVRLEISSDELTNVQQNQQGQVEVSSTGGTIRLVDVEQVVLSDGKKSTVQKLLDYYSAGTTNSAESPFADEAFSFYQGSVAYLEYEYLGLSKSDITIGSDNNDFINLLGGDDAANGGAGRDVLDGGTGSNFLTGGADADTFFLDGRGGTTTWSTITDFDGDSVNIWGWTDGLSELIQSVENAGADGFKGATFHFDLNNDGNIDTSITFSGLALNEVPAASAEVIADNGYLLFS